jgi:DNA-binding HxlR family transcriptional regulator
MSDAKNYIVELLKLIANHDGGWSWYQLDRALSARGLMLKMPLTAVLQQVEDEGLIRSAAGHNPSQPVYSITDMGRARIAE